MPDSAAKIHWVATALLAHKAAIGDRGTRQKCCVAHSVKRESRKYHPKSVCSARKIAIKPRGLCDGCQQFRALNAAFGKVYCTKCLKALPDQPATEGQLNYLQILGIATPEHIGRRSASELITATLDQRPATAKQIEYLQAIGVPIRANLSQNEASKLLDNVTPIRYYALAFCHDYYQRVRRANGQFAPGNMRGVSAEFLENQASQITRWILAEPTLFMSVQLIEETRERNGGDVPRDATFYEIKRRLSARAPASGVDSFLSALCKWFFR